MNPGKISISRNNHGEIHIEIEDEKSGIDFVRVKLTADQLGRAVTGEGCVGCEFETHALHRVGCTAEHKEEVVPYSGTWRCRTEQMQAEMRKALEPFEVDGWKVRSGDLGNSHRKTEGGYRCVFFRHVKPDGTPVLE